MTSTLSQATFTPHTALAQAAVKAPPAPSNAPVHQASLSHVPDAVSIAANGEGSPAAPKLSALGKIVYATGKGLARLDLYGGAALGGALGLGASYALLGHASWLMPLVGAGLFGFEAADAHAAQLALDQGVKSPAFQERVKHRRSLTPCGAASHMVSLVGAGAAFGLGLGYVGGVPGMVVSLVGASAVSGLVVYGASKAEKAILQSAA